jgi:uncharacterized membrane protein
MRKQEFLDRLRAKFSGLPSGEIEERIRFYEEMIEDRMEDGLEEEDAVAAIVSEDAIPTGGVAPSSKPQPEQAAKRDKRRLSAWEIVLLVLGSPIWISLIVAAFAVLLAIYAVLWSVIVSLWASFGALIGGGLGGVVAGVGFCLGVNPAAGAALLGAGLVCAGLSVFLFFGCRAATKGVAVLTKKTAQGVKTCFVGKERR